MQTNGVKCSYGRVVLAASHLKSVYHRDIVLNLFDCLEVALLIPLNKSGRWALVLALLVVNRSETRDKVTVASGLTPSLGSGSRSLGGGVGGSCPLGGSRWWETGLAGKVDIPTNSICWITC